MITKNRKFKIYVAGALNAMACDYIKNVHKMILWGNFIHKKGFAVFVPGIDFLCGVVSGDWNYLDYFDNSQPWLKASDAVFVTPEWESSKGTRVEIETAKKQNIPVFFKVKDMVEYFSTHTLNESSLYND